MSGGVVHKLPGDLRKALIADPTALDAWKDIAALARNEFISWVEDAKQDMTRERPAFAEQVAERRLGVSAGLGASIANARADSGRLGAPDRRVRYPRCRSVRLERPARPVLWARIMALSTLPSERSAGSPGRVRHPRPALNELALLFRYIPANERQLAPAGPPPLSGVRFPLYPGKGTPVPGVAHPCRDALLGRRRRPAR